MSVDTGGMGMRRRGFGRDQGFTLIELLVVVIIVGILAAVAVPVFLNQRNKAADKVTRANMRNLNAEIITARENKNQVLQEITGSFWSIGTYCGTGTVLKVKDQNFGTGSDTCGANWLTITHNIALAAGSTDASIRALMTDGWGQPMLFNENQKEAGHGCDVEDQITSVGSDGSYSTGPLLVGFIPLGPCS